MPKPIVTALDQAAHSFGPEAEREKRRLLETLAGESRLSATDLLSLRDTLSFLSAFPDSPSILRLVRAESERLRERVTRLPNGPENDRIWNLGFPGSYNTHPYSYAVTSTLARYHPKQVDVDWDPFPDDTSLVDVLVTLVHGSEAIGLEDIALSLDDWLDASRGDREQTDLAVILDRFESAVPDPAQRAHLFEKIDLPIRLPFRDGIPGGGEIEFPHGPITYQRKPLDRSHPPVAPVVLRPMSGERRVSKREGTELLRLCLLELCSRNLEIYPLGYANPSDVHWIPIGRGIRMLVAGVLPAHRSAFDSLYYFAAVKNGRMIGYGPVSVFLGFCEMGLNLFPEYRGSEVWFLYSHFMRALHQYLGVECFYLTRYAMGENNEAAIRTGAFWYYWKMGFRPTNPEVRELAESELQKMKRNPKYRSDRRMLRRLSHTEMTFDLSGGRVKPLRMGELGLAATRALYGTHGGNLARARTRCVRVVRERLGIDDWERWSPDQRTAMERIAPLWMQVARLADWPIREKRKLIRFTREKGAGSEIRACQIARNFESLRKSLATLAHSVTIDGQ